MDNTQIIMTLVGAIVLILFYTRWNQRRKLKQKIQREWGTVPRKTRLDQEKSLNQSYENLRQRVVTDSTVDDITWYDLNLFAIFQDINHTRSSIGAEELYRRLRQFNFNHQDQEKLDEIMNFYIEHPKKREQMEYTFAKLGKKDHNSVTRYLTTSEKKKVTSLALFILLGSLPFIGLLLILFGFQALGFYTLFGSIVFNLGYSTKKKFEIGLDLMSMSYFIEMLTTAKKLAKINHPLQHEMKTLLRPFKRVMRFSFAFRVNDSSELSILMDYLNMLFMLPFIAYYYVFNQIKNLEEEGILLWQLLGDLEVAYAILNYRETLNYYTDPHFTQETDVRAEGVYHPLIEDPVPNPVSWTRNTLVSGSNASGKSTYVKSVAINCILAQTIYTCLATDFTMKRGHVLTSMAVEDDVIMGDSYFIAEIKSLKRVLDLVETNERCYLFIDEILRGTNTVERIAASSSIIHWINEYPSLAFVATHDIELTEILKDECTNVHFKETVTDEEGIQFDYVLQSGPATSRNALSLLQTMHFPDSIVANAKEKAAHFDETQDWLFFED